MWTVTTAGTTVGYAGEGNLRWVVGTARTVDSDADPPVPLSRAALAGILYLLRTGIAWQQLPTAAFGVSGSTCWRRLARWHDHGVWQRLHEMLLAELRSAGALDLAHAVVDSSHLRALKGGTRSGRARSTVPDPAPSTT